MRTIDSIRADLDQAESLLAHFRAPWDEHDTPRPFFELKDALEAQQRALVGLLLRVESDEKINSAARGRLNTLEILS